MEILEINDSISRTRAGTRYSVIIRIDDLRNIKIYNNILYYLSELDKYIIGKDLKLLCLYHDYIIKVI